VRRARLPDLKRAVAELLEDATWEEVALDGEDIFDGSLN